MADRFAGLETLTVYRCYCERCGEACPETDADAAMARALARERGFIWQGRAWLCGDCFKAEPTFDPRGWALPLKMEQAALAAAMEADRGPGF